MFSNANACVKGEGVLVLATVKRWSDTTVAACAEGAGGRRLVKG